MQQDLKTISEKEIVNLSERLNNIASSRPVMRIFQETKGFKLRYGQTTEIDTSLDAFLPYEKVLEADNDQLREFIKAATPRVDRLLLDLDFFAQRENTLIKLYHETIDSKAWDEAERINSKLKWVSAELGNLRRTIETTS